MEIQLKAIGKIRSPFKQKFCTPRQAGLSDKVSSKVILEEWLPEGILSDLVNFSHIWLVSYFHKKGPSRINGKIRPPRLKGEKKGVFSTRSPHRPNPIGLSLVKLLHVDPSKRELLIAGTDLIDGTPIIDIKPYIPDYDHAENPQVGWTEQAKETLFKVEFSNKTLETLETSSNREYKDLLEQTLQFEVRNLVDRGSSNSEGIYKSMIGEFDVYFRYEGEKVIVEKLMPIQPTDNP